MIPLIHYFEEKCVYNAPILSENCFGEQLIILMTKLFYFENKRLSLVLMERTAS